MNVIKVNIYYKSKNILADTFEINISEKIRSLDSAREVIVSHLDKFYSDVKYKLSFFTSFDGSSEINLEFEEDIKLLREIRLKQLLK